MKSRVSILIFIFTFFFYQLQAQDIPIGTWRTHFSYYNTQYIVDTPDRVYASSGNGIFYIDKSDNSVIRLSRLDGLQGNDVSALGYNPDFKALFIGYASGKLDVIIDGEISNYDLTANSQVIGSKKMNGFVHQGMFTYACTDYGVLKFDIQKLEVKEVYREIGTDAVQIGVYDAGVLNDSIYVLSDEGLLASSLNASINLLDYRNWVRHNSDENYPSEHPSVLAVKENELLLGVDNLGLFVYDGNGSWNSLDALTGQIFKDASSNGSEVLISSGLSVNKISGNNSLETISSELIKAPNAAIQVNEELWIADGVNGLLINRSGSFENIVPNGPVSNSCYNLKAGSNMVLFAPGGFSSEMKPSNNESGFSIFTDGVWNNYGSLSGAVDIPEFHDVTSVAYQPETQTIYAASAGYGLLKLNADGSTKVIDNTSTTLQNTTGEENGVLISDIATVYDGVWVLNYGADVPLNFLTNDGDLIQHPLSSSLARFAVQVLPVNEVIWLRVHPNLGGGLIAYNYQTKETRYLDDDIGDGGLVSQRVNDIAVDREGYIWAATTEGISVFTSPLSIMTGDVDAIEPIYEGLPLFYQQEVLSITVDGGNRKWIGTNSGAHLFSADGDEDIIYFNLDNSPFSNNRIDDIAINNQSGEVFFSTSDGLVSYRSSSSESTDKHADVKVFPNPVNRDFKGQVGISGLAQDAQVKITDVSGKLIWQTQANGGTASWNVNDYNGSRVSTGIYLVFSSTADGDDTFVAKIAVVN
ncbi:type IX secretion system anionic LPS delivery protein PorZ [Fulvivirga ligni]|uniref:type IX secretion system anionic LPS delivery protein PorZ n=1 Tax=Fulvivirga ligni TaxID=2904246 RepID=UPI001F30D1BD|nr:T9SS type A sorting domain-containing protein [Fulvivirga ligni]UII22941.1 T9SS type A sorting domain-containing protein [Fulvivirga ligni]